MTKPCGGGIGPMRTRNPPARMHLTAPDDDGGDASDGGQWQRRRARIRQNKGQLWQVKVEIEPTQHCELTRHTHTMRRCRSTRRRRGPTATSSGSHGKHRQRTQTRGRRGWDGVHAHHKHDGGIGGARDDGDVVDDGEDDGHGWRGERGRWSRWRHGGALGCIRDGPRAMAMVG